MAPMRPVPSSIGGSRSLYVVLQLANRGKYLIGLMILDYIVCSFAFWWIEGHSVFTSFWWAIVTGQTVGYGDIIPKTSSGMVIAMFLMLSMWLLSLITGAYITARVVIDANEWSHDEQERLERSQMRLERAMGTLYPCWTDLPPLNWNGEHAEECTCTV